MSGITNIVGSARGNVLAGTLLLAIGGAMPAIALDLGVDVGVGGVDVGVDVGVGGGGVDVGADVGVGGAGVGADVSVGGTGGGVTAGVEAGVSTGGTTPGGTAVSTCIGVLTSCPQSAATDPGGDNPIPGGGGGNPGGGPDGGPDNPVVTRGTQPGGGLGYIVPQDQLLGTVVLSADRKVIGIVDHVEPAGNGSYRIRIQLSDALGINETHTMIQARPRQIRHNQFRVNLRLNEFLTRI